MKSLTQFIQKMIALKGIRYLISGGTSAVVYLGLTWLLEFEGFHYIATVSIAFVAAAIVSFLLQKFFTFQHKEVDGVHIQFSFFLVLGIVNLILNDILVYIQIHYLDVPYLVLAAAIANVTVALYSYFVYNNWIFKKKLGHTIEEKIIL